MKTLTVCSLISLVLLTACNSNTEEARRPLPPTPTLSLDGKIVDLTHSFSEETIYWVTAKEFELDVVAKGQTDKGFYYSANNFATAEHGGTHIDAPIHFAENRQSVDEIPLEKLIGSAIKIDVSAQAKNNPDYLISIEDFKNWEAKHNSQIPDGSIVLLQTGYSEFYPDKVKYLGTDQRGPDALKLLHFPGLDPEAAEWLVNNRKINAIGIDTPSIDYGQSEFFKSHVSLMTQDIPAFENLTNLNKLPENDFQVIALPIKIKGGSGGPLRIVAILK
ncbi:cyclase family protein [Leptobacterium flavescens]|uniref:Cyclase family protein n=1 Tax=Leptobacterium flavescens TaxID=472055 RepID=A0A6P0UR65_9FLAO|nr:cyclase family protein [Leptobacterium flavescens]NER15022.1 cyclase family protein [Leptobacterium flavescens]